MSEAKGMVKNMATSKKEDMVKFRLFRDNDRYKAPLFVGVNGKAYLVERGVDVEMPRSVHEVIVNSLNQMNVAEAAMESAKQIELIQG